MPHQPRAVSPVSLETISQPSEWTSDPDELLGSDDELDDAARDAKRRRVERLAEAHLRGRPLFIASAGLRGPFDQGWRNPWRKERRVVKKVDTKGRGKKSRPGKSPAVQETQTGNGKRKSVLRESSGPTDSFVSARETNSLHLSKSAQKSNAAAVPEPIARESPPLPKRIREESTAVEDNTFIDPGSVNWLRKDKKRMNFKSFEPPTSPTPKAAQRKIAEPRSRDTASRSISIALASPRASSIASPRKIKTPAKPQPSNPAAGTPRASAYSKNPQAGKPSPSGLAGSAHMDKGASFQVVSSTSQLSRFEYRRLREPRSSPRLELISPPMGNGTADVPAEAPPDETTNEDADLVPVDNDVHMAEPEDAVEDDLAPVDKDLAQENHAAGMNGHQAQATSDHQAQAPSVHLSKSIRFADETEGANSTSTYQPPSTEPNTYEELPSAQQVPVQPGVSDRMTSLHSTAVPKMASHNNPDVDSTPDTQLSTQAALFHAQKSFQDDLESPIRSYGITPGHQNGVDPGDESLLARETPLFRPDTSERALPRHIRLSEAGKANFMSTQCMIDAATPFTFSTEKKPRAFRSISPPKTNSVKPRAIHTAKAVSFTGSPPPDQEESVLRPHSRSPTPCAPNNSANSNPRRSTNQAPPSLPFALSGSTQHGTAQDGQGAQYADSFNLSQAIADAGSWLQQSFEIVTGSPRPSQEQVPTEAAPR